MNYKLRFVQQFDKRDEQSFLALEQSFIDLERRTPGMAAGKRYVSIIGREPTNTMVWEAEFDSLEAATSALAAIEQNPDHDALLSQQICFMRDTYVELYRALN